MQNRYPYSSYGICSHLLVGTKTDKTGKLKLLAVHVYALCAEKISKSCKTLVILITFGM